MNKSTPTVADIEAAKADVERLLAELARVAAIRTPLVSGRDKNGGYKRRPGVPPTEFDAAIFAVEEADLALKAAQRREDCLLRRVTDLAARKRRAPERQRETAEQIRDTWASMQSALSELDAALGDGDQPSISTERKAFGTAFDAIAAKLDGDLAAVVSGRFAASRVVDVLQNRPVKLPGQAIDAHRSIPTW
jgi:hypothetical protein